LQDRPAKLETMARIVRHLAFPTQDPDLLITRYLVVEVRLIREMKGIGLKIENLGPGSRMEGNKSAKKR
jgi:hypothetical protein